MRPHIENLIKMHRESFKNHVADVRGQGDMITINWARPGTRNYSIHYAMGLFNPGLLIVAGDMGEAVYQWSDAISLSFLADCELDYFAGKCRASETGKEYRHWYQEKVEAALEEHEKELLEEYEELPPLYVEHKEDLLLNTDDHHDWIECLQDLDFDGKGHPLGLGWWDYWPGIGWGHDTRLIAHWLGLRMAWEQLQGTGSEGLNNA